jgi:hypothetical protein
MTMTLNEAIAEAAEAKSESYVYPSYNALMADYTQCMKAAAKEHNVPFDMDLMAANWHAVEEALMHMKDAVVQPAEEGEK